MPRLKDDNSGAIVEVAPELVDKLAMYGFAFSPLDDAETAPDEAVEPAAPKPIRRRKAKTEA